MDEVAALKQAKTRLDIRTFHLLASLVVDSGYLLQKIATRRGVEPDSRFIVVDMIDQDAGSAEEHWG